MRASGKMTSPIEEDVRESRKNFDAFAWPPPPCRFVSFEWIMARYSFLIVRRHHWYIICGN